MSDFAALSLIGLVLGSLGTASVLAYFILTRGTVRLVEAPGGSADQRSLQLSNKNPHPVFVVAVGPVLGDGTIDHDFAPLGLLARRRIEARGTLLLPVPVVLAIYGTYQETFGGRLGWWIRLETGKICYTHGWITRRLWSLAAKIDPIAMCKHAEKRRLMRKDWEEEYERRQ